MIEEKDNEGTRWFGGGARGSTSKFPSRDINRLSRRKISAVQNVLLHTTLRLAQGEDLSVVNFVGSSLPELADVAFLVGFMGAQEVLLTSDLEHGTHACGFTLACRSKYGTTYAMHLFHGRLTGMEIADPEGITAIYVRAGKLPMYSMVLSLVGPAKDEESKETGYRHNLPRLLTTDPTYTGAKAKSERSRQRNERESSLAGRTFKAICQGHAGLQLLVNWNELIVNELV